MSPDVAYFVLGPDLGQTGNPTPAGVLWMFVTGLMADGISRAAGNRSMPWGAGPAAPC